MKIDFSRASDHVGLKVTDRNVSFTDTLEEGDELRVQVVANDKGSVIIKTEGGQVFRARLEFGVTLEPGDAALLRVTGKEDASVLMALLGDETVGKVENSEQILIRSFEDKSLLAYAGKLSELNMPVREEIARIMRELVSQNPDMSLDEAAFIASNKLADNAEMINAALAVISDDVKTGEMIKHLLATLEQYSMITRAGSDTDMTTQAQGISHDVAGDSTQDMTLTDWLMRLLTVTDKSDKTPVWEQLLEIKQLSSGIITHVDYNLQSRSIKNNEKILQEAIIAGEKADAGGNASGVRVTETDGAAGHAAAAASLYSGDVVKAENNGIISPAVMQNQHEAEKLHAKDPAGAGIAASLPDELKPVSANVTAGTDEVIRESELIKTQSQVPSKVAAKILAGLPEFRNTPEEALERFSDILLRAAKDSINTMSSENETEKLSFLAEKLFTAVERNDRNIGQQLRFAKEEFFTRLMLIEEAASRAAPQLKAQLNDQIQKITLNVRLQGSIDHFAYMQLPVVLGNEKKTAELYVYKRKGGGKRVDPDDVNVLLALDLENMGHWEGLINIKKKDVSLRMEVAGEDKKEFFSGKTVLLHELLDEAGFKLVGTNITCSPKETTPLSALETLRRHKAARPGTIDYMV